jgi:hypothetical protein
MASRLIPRIEKFGASTANYGAFPVGTDDHRSAASRSPKGCGINLRLCQSRSGVAGRLGFAFLAQQVGRRVSGQLMGYGAAIGPRCRSSRGLRTALFFRSCLAFVFGRDESHFLQSECPINCLFGCVHRLSCDHHARDRCLRFKTPRSMP